MRVAFGLKPLCACFLVYSCLWGRAHEVRPGYLEITEVEENRFEVFWKIPHKAGRRIALEAGFPETCKALTLISTEIMADAVVQRWTIAGPVGGFANQVITIAGLEKTLTDVLLRLQFADGRAYSRLIRPDQPGFTVPEKETRWGVSLDYSTLGIEHILAGADHLLFVLALLLLTRGRRQLVLTITAFTVAHSLTLSLAVLGLVRVPTAPVEAVISLSILFLAVELIRGRDGHEGLAQKKPWLVSFSFGLLHGFGFAGALSQVGLPQTEIPSALLFFNIGVELGQLLFVFAALGLFRLLTRIKSVWPTWPRTSLVYAIGSLSVFWLIQRVVLF